MENKFNETVFFEACESRDITTAKRLLREVDPSSLKQWRTSEDRTCLHVAVVAGDPDLLRKTAKKLPVLMKNTDKKGDTALHLAVGMYRVDLVKQLLDLGADLSNCENKTWEGRTCLHVAVMAGGYSVLIRKIAKKLPELIKKTDSQGDTALHLAVKKYRMDLVKELANLKAELCDCENNKRETPLKMAVRLGFVEAVDLLVTSTSNALQIQNNCILHWAVKHNQVKLVQILIKQKVGLSKLINQPASDDEGDELSQSNGDTNTQQAQPIVLRGDTPLHIAARNKYEHMVDLLLRVDGVNKNACNSEGKTPLDIAREFTEYHESMGIIKKLIDYPDKCKTFMYCAPMVSHAKHRNATNMVNEAFRERRAAELVVAALLATMTFTAAFTLPGGFNTEAPQSEQGHSQVAEAPQSDQGSPILITLVSFKLFLIFDCIAFFLSLLACIMWEMSSELTTGDKMLFMTLNGLVVCCSFGFTAYGFMAAVYAMLARKVKKFAWVILGSLIFITWGGFVAFMYQHCVGLDSTASMVYLVYSMILLKKYGIEPSVLGFCSFSVGLLNYSLI